MTTSELSYPVLWFSQNTVGVEKSEHQLSLCSKTAIKYGYFKNMVLVDSKGMTLKINGAEKLHGVGAFWGYNIFLNQRIKVRLQVEDSFQLQLDEVKQRVLNAFRKWHGWRTRGDFKELKNHVTNAKSISEIIDCLMEKENTGQ